MSNIVILPDWVDNGVPVYDPGIMAAVVKSHADGTVTVVHEVGPIGPIVPRHAVYRPATSAEIAAANNEEMGHADYLIELASYWRTAADARLQVLCRDDSGDWIIFDNATGAPFDDRAFRTYYDADMARLAIKHG